MRKLLIVACLLLAPSIKAATVPYIQSTNTFQSSGVINIASGTIRRFFASTVTISNVSSLASTGTFVFNGSTFSGTKTDRSSTTYTGVSTFTTPTYMFKVIIGTNSERSSDSTFLNARTADSSISGNAHAFSDSGIFQRPGTVAYNSFDHRIAIQGANNYDHIAGFQALPVFNSTGTTSNNYSIYSGLTVNSSTVTNHYALYASSPVTTGGGMVTNSYGVWAEKGLTNFMGNGILGSTDGSNACTGCYGEYISSAVTTSSNVGPSGQFFSAAAITLSSGDWDVGGSITFARNGATMSTIYFFAGIGTADGNSAAGLVNAINSLDFGISSTTALTSVGINTPITRKVVTVPTPFYLKGYAEVYTVGNPVFKANFWARRASH